MSRFEAYRMIRRRAIDAGVSCHSFRATGITIYLENNRTLETAQRIAAHESPRTTKLYDRTEDQITLAAKFTTGAILAVDGRDPSETPLTGLILATRASASRVPSGSRHPAFFRWQRSRRNRQWRKLRPRIYRKMSKSSYKSDPRK